LSNDPTNDGRRTPSAGGDPARDATGAAPGLLEGPERLVGSRVLDFELTGVLGTGGMSVVYRGRHRLTGQEVAVKILPPELAIHDELKARFVEEARLLALLEHPNIVTLNNFTETGGRHCLIMQFVEGVTFETRLLELKHVPWREVVQVGVQVCLALEHAHKQNVIHRDIKPSNVIVRSDGTVKVTDFGIAKMVGQSRLTSTGQTMGTVRYMSPEQVRGRPLDARSDLYSLGVTLFEGLAGKTPFDGENQFSIMEQHLHKRPPTLASFGAQVPPGLERVLQRSLEKKAEDRFPDASSFREALESLVRDGAPAKGASPSSRRRGRRLLAGALGAVVIAAGVALGLHQMSVAPSGANSTGASGKRPDKTDKTAAPSDKSPPARSAWPEAHALADLKLETDKKLPETQLRIQAVRALDAAELTRIETSYRALVRELAVFLAGEPSAGAALRAPVAAMNLVVVPDWVLGDAKRWPGFGVEAGKSYGSRYVEPKKTLFVADGAGYLDKELPYGIALHVLTPIDALSTETCFDLAERFAAVHLKRPQ
jgi:serine/threonine protein kinase